MDFSSSSTGWKCVFLAFLCVLSLTCRRNERPSKSDANLPAAGSVRVTEPGLSGFDVWHPCVSENPLPGAVMKRSRCGPQTVPPDLVSIEGGGCDRRMRTMTDAVRVLAYVPDCTDAAVAKLEALANVRHDAEILSNLSAAYYLRAQRKDRPSDLVRALDAADAAVALAPGSTQANFNRALSEEALGFSSDSIRSWDVVRRGAASGWSREAADHSSRLTRERTRSAATQWRLNEERLPEVARRRDRKAIETLIAPYRAAAQRFVEDTVLVAWAAASANGNQAAATAQLQLAEMIAAALAQLTRDRYLRDVVEQIRRSDPAAQATIRRGIAAFAEGRVHERKIRNEDATAEAYGRAERAFAEVRNPFRLMAMIKRAAPLSLSGRFDEALQTLATVEAEAKSAKYPSLLARVHTGRGFVAMLQGRLLDSITEYSDAETTFMRIADVENYCNSVARTIGSYRLIGNHDLTWRKIFTVRDYAPAILEPQSRHLLLGEIAASALELEYPRVALRYQTSAIAVLQDALARDANDDRIVAQLISNLSVALRGRAAIHAHLGDSKAAQRDLDEALSRIGTEIPAPEAAVLNGFRARLAEVQAQTLLKTDRKQAIAALSRGIDYASRTHFSSLIASLFVQRAELYRLEGNRAAELVDLRAALRALRREERAMLSAKRQVQAAEQMWSAYFARYQDTYRQLIQRLVEHGSDAEAFEYAEKARGFEPLSLILKREDVPPEFRARIRDGEPFRLEDVRQTLPAGTFLLQYAVMADQTHVWTVWNDDFHRTTLPVTHAQIEQWTNTLQRLGASGDIGGFDDALADPYAALLREPLARIAKIKAAGMVPRVVIVPDRSMHGLPFAALRDGRRHVVQDHIVSVAASATLYAFSLAKDRQRAATPLGTMLLVADPAFDEDMEIAHDLLRLPWARSEATQIDQLYRDVMQIDPLFAERATASEFLRLAASSSIIHVAAHGIANPDIPSRSFLLFARSGSDSGAVDAERLLTQLRLEAARLAVLAACSSAGGTPVGPEGLAPLVRPLLVAGVPGVVGTLWNVRENSETAELLVRFHRHYRNGRDADDALRQAQVEMLEDPELARSSAVVWAPFQAIGHASSPFQPQSRR